MSKTKPVYSIKSNLTPHNAAEKGYRFVDDVPDLRKILNEVLSIASENGYVLGSAKDENRIGLYQKIEEVI